MLKQNRPLLLFDGECHLCNRWVDFILKHEIKDSFLFASLQSEKGKRVLEHFHIPASVDSVVVIMNGKAYIYSEAVLKVLQIMPFYLRWLRFLRIIPRSWRDYSYKQFAKRRYKLFGEKLVCRIGTSSERSRFLQ